MKHRMIMYVYNDITTDARVQRAANALADHFDLTLISTQKGKEIQDQKYKNVLVSGGASKLNLFGSIYAAFRCIRKERPDYVYCHDYYSAVLAYLLLKTKYKGRIIYDAHELIIPEKEYPDRRQSFFYWFEQRIVKKVDLLICASKERGDLMQKHYKLITTPLVIDNISQLAISSDSETADVLKSLDSFFQQPGTTVVYAGAVTKTRRINDLLETVASMSLQFKLLIVGNGPFLSELRDEASKYTKLVTAFTGGVPYKSLGAILSRCDIGFLYYPSDTLNNTYCASNKIYEYASVGLPMLANENPTVKAILNKSKIGLSTGDFKAGLIRISAEINFYKQMCEVFTTNNQWSSEASLLLERIKAIPLI